MNNLKRALKGWQKMTFGNIDTQIVSKIVELNELDQLLIEGAERLDEEPSRAGLLDDL